MLFDALRVQFDAATVWFSAALVLFDAATVVLHAEPCTAPPLPAPFAVAVEATTADEAVTFPAFDLAADFEAVTVTCAVAVTCAAVAALVVVAARASTAGTGT